MKRFITVVALAVVAFPATLPAMPIEPHSAGSPLTSRVPPYVTDHWAPEQQTPRDIPPRLPAQGTDVAAADQQAPARAPSPAPASAESEFDWADAGIGAAVTTGLLALSLAGGITVRRRQHRRASALAG